MQIDKKDTKKIQELQFYERTLQNLIMQKQAFQLELLETERAISELSKSNEDVFKLIGQIIIKADKEQTNKDLIKKKGLLSLRLDSIKKQEGELTKQIEILQKEIFKKIQ